MKIILHNLNNLDYLSLEQCLSEKSAAFNIIEQDAGEIKESHHGSFHEIVEVAVPVTQIAISVLTLWLHTRKNKKVRTITIQDENGEKVTADLDKPESFNSEALKDVKDILEQLTKL